MKGNFENSRQLALKKFVNRDHTYLNGSDVLVFIPVHNEESTISKVISNVKANCNFDVLVINDGSTDNTNSILSNSEIEVFNLNHNKPTGAVVNITGLEIALKMGYKFVIKIDGDDQHDSHDIPRLYSHIVETKADEVIGSRHLNSFKANIFSLEGLGMWFCAKLVFFLSRQRITDSTSGFKIWNRKAYNVVIQAFQQGKLKEDSTFLIEELLIAAKNKLKLEEIAVVMQPRKFGKTKSYSKKKQLLFPLNLVLSIIRSFSPLRS